MREEQDSIKKDWKFSQRAACHVALLIRGGGWI